MHIDLVKHNALTHSRARRFTSEASRFTSRASRSWKSKVRGELKFENCDPFFFFLRPLQFSPAWRHLHYTKIFFIKKTQWFFSGTFAPKPLTQAFNFFDDLKNMFFPIFRGWRNLLFWGCWQTGGKYFSGRSWWRFLAPGLLLYFVSSEAVNKPELTSLFPRNDISMVDTKNKK